MGSKWWDPILKKPGLMSCSCCRGENRFESDVQMVEVLQKLIYKGRLLMTFIFVYACEYTMYLKLKLLKEEYCAKL